MDLDLKKLQILDPLKAQPTIDMDDQKGTSPFDPPDAYEPPCKSDIGYDDMHPYLQALVDEHRPCTEHLEAFEKMIEVVKKELVVSAQSFAIMKSFMTFFDEELIPHNRREERQLFPLLRRRMLETGEHSQSEVRITPVDALEAEHVRIIQTGSVAFGFLALAFQLEDKASAKKVLDLAVDRSLALIETLKLHIFREDEVVFGSAQELIEKADFDLMEA